MNETLERIAQAIFRDWFVDFGPTRRKLAGLTDPIEIMGGLVQDATRAAELAALFPDAFGDDGLPEGWEENALSGLGSIVTGKTPSTREPANFGMDMPFLKIPDMHGNMYVVHTQTGLSSIGTQSQPKKTVPAGSTSVSCIATPGLVVLNHRATQTNQQINSVIPNDMALQYFTYWSCRGLAQSVMIGGAGGSVFHNMNKQTFSSLPIVVPSERSGKAFSEIVEPIHSGILANVKQNQTLAATRDLLLPKLMSGEIRLRDAETMVEAAQ